MPKNFFKSNNTNILGIMFSKNIRITHMLDAKRIYKVQRHKYETATEKKNHSGDLTLKKLENEWLMEGRGRGREKSLKKRIHNGT